jgi:hypothetical protein
MFSLSRSFRDLGYGSNLFLAELTLLLLDWDAVEKVGSPFLSSPNDYST